MRATIALEDNSFKEDFCFMTDTRYLYQYFLEKSQTNKKETPLQTIKKQQKKKSKGGKKHGQLH